MTVISPPPLEPIEGEVSSKPYRCPWCKAIFAIEFARAQTLHTLRCPYCVMAVSMPASKETLAEIYKVFRDES